MGSNQPGENVKAADSYAQSAFFCQSALLTPMRYYSVGCGSLSHDDASRLTCIAPNAGHSPNVAHGMTNPCLSKSAVVCIYGIISPMPARDILHKIVKEALSKDGLDITHDPFTVSFGTRTVYVDSPLRDLAPTLESAPPLLGSNDASYPPSPAADQKPSSPDPTTTGQTGDVFR